MGLFEKAKQKKAEKERKFIEEFPYKNRYIVKQLDSTSLDLGLWEMLERDSYVIFNANEEPLYIAKGTLLMGKHHFIVTNPEKQVMGKVNKALISAPVLFEKKRRTCHVEISDGKSFEMETYISGKTREYHISGAGLTIRTDAWEKEFRIYKRNQKKPIAHIYKERSLEGLFYDKYIVGFDADNDAILAILLVIGLDTIRFSDN